MKILWLSNYRFTNEPIKATGTWLKVMGEELASNEDTILFNITQGITKSLIKEQVGNIRQYVLPAKSGIKNNLPKQKIINVITQIVNSIKPDLIHIWGTESYWGLLSARCHIRGNILLEIQGLTTQIKHHLYAGLTFSELIRCTGIKEIIKYKSHILFQPKIYAKVEQNEIEMIKAHKFISIQSSWSMNTVKVINNKGKLFRTVIPLRPEFIKAQNKWEFSNNYTLFTSASAMHSYKGIHVLIKALYHLKNQIPIVKLRIAGNKRKGIRQSGYERFLNALIKSYRLESNIEWLGSLESNYLVEELLKADVCVIPSYVESYGAALYEAIITGIPVIASYAGAMSEATSLTNRVQYFQPGDFYTCASLIDGSLKNNNKNLQTEPMNIDSKTAYNRQLEIYKTILK